MKKMTTLFFAACTLAMPATAQENADGNIETKTIRTYFDLVLGGKKLTYTVEQTLSPEQVESAQSIVWDVWKQANSSLKEERLIELSPLKNEKNSSWTLPSSLEPNAVMKYYYGSKGTRPEQGYPLFVYLHGSGDPTSEWSTGHSIAMYNEDEPSTYFIPQIPNTGNYYRWWQKSKQWAWEKLLRQAYLTGDIDPNRIYFFGISEGGYGSQRLASFYADYLAGAGPMAGGEPLKNAPAENCRNIAFNFRTGANDETFFRNILTGYTKDAFEALKEKYPDGFEHSIEIIPGYGHHIDYLQTTPWLKNYVRNPYPKHILWENYEMDDLYRKGFYNLYLEEDPRGTLSRRIYYVMDIEGNTINMDVKRVSYTTTESQNGIEMAFKRSYYVNNKGKIRIYLNDQLVDLSKPVRVVANGKLLFEGNVACDVKNMVNSLATFYDPARIYPASVLINLSQESLDVDGVELNEASAPTHYYDLGGRRVENPQNGVFITNKGKKVVIK